MSNLLGPKVHVSWEKVREKRCEEKRGAELGSQSCEMPT
jgi:hypothetical protein